MTGKEIAGVPVVADLNNASSFICQQWVDEVFVNVDETYPYPQELIEELLEMGMPVHVNLAKVRSTPGQKQFVEAIGGYTAVSYTHLVTKPHATVWILWKNCQIWVSICRSMQTASQEKTDFLLNGTVIKS